MDIRNIEKYKLLCRKYLMTLNTYDLRNYVRAIGVTSPTSKKKETQIEEALAILCGEISAPIKSTRGAPVKNADVDPRILEKMDDIKRELEWEENTTPCETIPDFKKRLAEFREKKTDLLRFESPDYEDAQIFNEIHRGQFQIFSEVGYILPLNLREGAQRQIIVPQELVQAHNLREGDTVSCRVRKGDKAFVVAQVITVNGFSGNRQRVWFDEALVDYPKKKISFTQGVKTDNGALKYIDWFLPVANGQRGCIVSAPKTGKSTILLEMVKVASLLNDDLTVLALLIDQSPELIGQYRKIMPAENLVYTTYEDTVDRQIFLAELLLKRAKRYAEYGRNVLLIIDSISALANAYNDTDDSAGGRIIFGGLEKNTLHYIKRYFGSARCLENGGALTIIGAVSSNTGNPADDAIVSELNPIANWELRLDDGLARKRVYPAINPLDSRVQLPDFETAKAVCDEAVLKKGTETFIRTLNGAENLEKMNRLMKNEGEK